MARIEVDELLCSKLKVKYPEIRGLTYTGVAEWALRKVLAEAKQ